MSVDSSTTTADLSRLVAVARASGPDQLDELCVNTIRTLSMDTVHSANSGHPGTPTALAPVAYYLWQRFLRYDTNDPIWPNRDRFVLSVDHASMLLYSLLHLSRGKVVSKASGVEPKTGPLGQGVANSVGKAIAGKWMAARYNQPGFEDFIDFNVYALCDDSCMMEAVTGEAASLAGRLKLSNLCWIYDNNQITTGRNTALPFREDVITSFLGYGWNVTRVRDAND